MIRNPSRSMDRLIRIVAELLFCANLFSEDSLLGPFGSG